MKILETHFRSIHLHFVRIDYVKLFKLFIFNKHNASTDFSNILLMMEKTLLKWIFQLSKCILIYYWLCEKLFQRIFDEFKCINLLRFDRQIYMLDYLTSPRNRLKIWLKSQILLKNYLISDIIQKVFAALNFTQVNHCEF